MSTYFEKMTEKARQELLNITENQENAIDLIASNYYGTKTCGAESISSRLAVQYYALNPNIANLQTEDSDGWWQNEEYEPNTVSSRVLPITQTQTTSEEWGKNFFSSFALCEVEGKYSLRLPLTDDLGTFSSPFANLTMSAEDFNLALQTITSKLGIEFKEASTPVQVPYQRKTSFAGIKNFALGLSGQGGKTKSDFRGVMNIVSKAKSGYAFTNVEKLIRVYDEIFNVEVEKQAKYNPSVAKNKVNADIKFASRILANILMCRVTDFGNWEINKVVIKCLSLQFANVINRNGFTSEQLKQITEIAVSSAGDVCEQMGYTQESLTKQMMLAGYKYSKMPSNIKDALLLAKEADYNAYLIGVKQEVADETNDSQLTEPAFVATPVAEEIVENDNLPIFVDEEYEIVNFDDELEIDENLDDVYITEIIAQMYPKIKGLNAPEIIQILESKVISEEQRAKILEKFFPKKYNALMAPERVFLLESPDATKNSKEELIARITNKKFVNLKLPSRRLVLPSYEEFEQMLAKNAEVEESSASEEDAKQLAEIVTEDNSQMADSGKQPKKLSIKTVKKYVYGQIQRVVYDEIVKATNAINANRCSKYGGKEKAKTFTQVLSLTLCYLTKRQTGKMKTTKFSGINDLTIYSRCRQLSSLIHHMSETLIDKIVEASAGNPPKKDERMSTFINRLSKQFCKMGEEEGVTVTQYFKHAMAEYAKIYADGDFTDVFETKK